MGWRIFNAMYCVFTKLFRPHTSTDIILTLCYVIFSVDSSKSICNFQSGQVLQWVVVMSFESGNVECLSFVSIVFVCWGVREGCDWGCVIYLLCFHFDMSHLFKEGKLFRPLQSFLCLGLCSWIFKWYGIYT